MTISERIKKARERADLTRERVAAECDVSVGTVRNWESGDQSPHLSHVPDLVRVLGCTAHWLIYGKERGT